MCFAPKLESCFGHSISKMGGILFQLISQRSVLREQIKNLDGCTLCELVESTSKMMPITGGGRVFENR